MIIFAQDESISIKSESDTNLLKQYQSDLQDVIEDLSGSYDVKTFSFGEQYRDGIEFQFADKTSNQSAILEHIGDLYGDQNLGAVVFATDGIYNEGKDPRYANRSFTAPLYTIAMGDTTPDRDLAIRQVFYNNIAYLGDKASIQVDITAYNCEGSRSTLSIQHISADKREILAEVPFTIGSEDHFTTLELAIPQSFTGLQRYRAMVTSLQGEKSLVNNRKDFFIDVIDARQKILILAASPHPDIAAIKSSLEKNKNYEIETALLKGFKGMIDDYDFIILHQLPARGLDDTAVLREINVKKKPRMIVVGAQSNLGALNQFQSLVSIKPKTGSLNEVQAIENSAFSYFNTSDLLKQNINRFPPMDAPFADYSVSAGAEVLLYQRIGKIETDFPLLVIGEEVGIKSAILCAEGLWRWKLFNYLQFEHSDIFDELVSKSIQYVALKEDKRKFRVFQADNLLAENEDALFDAEFYNQSYQLINDPDITMTIYNSKREAFNFGFSRKNDAYVLDAGRLPVDDYTWTASTQWEGEKHSASGQFSVQAIEKESYATVANHDLLAGLASATAGQMLYPSEVSQLTSILRENSQLKPLYYRIIQTRSAIHLKWIFILLCGLLVLEWSLRRYLGTY